MTDIRICPHCGSSMVAIMEEKICGITLKCRIKCFSCKFTVEKPTKRAAYKVWKKECKENG